MARKLNVDCAAAMVGWDFHSGINHPVYVFTVKMSLPVHCIVYLIYV